MRIIMGFYCKLYIFKWLKYMGIFLSSDVSLYSIIHQLKRRVFYDSFLYKSHIICLKYFLVILSKICPSLGIGIHTRWISYILYISHLFFFCFISPHPRVIIIILMTTIEFIIVGTLLISGNCNRL